MAQFHPSQNDRSRIDRAARGEAPRPLGDSKARPVWSAAFMMMFHRFALRGLIVMGLMHFFTARAQDRSNLLKWEEGADPRTVGARVVKRFLASPHPNFGVFTTPAQYITYTEVCTWYGALTFCAATQDKPLESQLAARFAPLFSSEAKLLPEPVEVDRSVFGIVPLELFLASHDHRYLKLGLNCADQQWENSAHPVPAGSEEAGWIKRGLSWQTRFWIDDMYMITVLQTEAFRVTADVKYIDRAALETVAYLDQLQQANGLFYHAPDVPVFWGRGNGWMAAGLAELLSALPQNHALRPRLLDGYRRMMTALRATQDEQGMWHQIVDDPKSWPETSCTGMFAFALIRGVRAGWLDEKDYALPARRAWTALVGYLDADGNMTQVCEGTPKMNDRTYYLNRRRLTGAMYGQAPVLWCATALLAEKP